MSADRRARYRITFEVEARETGAEWDEEYLAYCVKERIKSLGQDKTPVWDNESWSRASFDLRRPRNFQFERFHVREVAK